jgi:plasmid stability protein
LKTLTIRNVPDDLSEALQRERTRRGRSLNQTVLDLLRQRLALGTMPSNGLGRLAGTWSAQDLRTFEQATGMFEAVDDEVWR